MASESNLEDKNNPTVPSSDVSTAVQAKKEIRDEKVPKPRESKEFSLKQDGFDMNIVSENFENTLLEQNDISIPNYLLAYRELERFFDLMGSVFSFVGTDINTKVATLTKLRQTHVVGGSYGTVGKMLDFETHVYGPAKSARSKKLSHKLDKNSGMFTFLCLHRTLEFSMHFMEAMIVASDDGALSHIAQEVYRNTLSQYHAWLVRKGVHISMYTLPTKYHLLERVSKHPYADSNAIATRMTASMKPVYERTQILYRMYKVDEIVCSVTIEL